MLDLLMDFSEAECSAATPAKVNEETSENTIRFDEINVENNGSCHNEIGDLGFGEHVQINASAETIGNDIGIENLVETPSKANESPSVVSGGTTPLKKGYGLKKWRRIRRDFTKDGGTDDFNRILKRGLPNASQTKRPQDLSAVIKQKGEGSIASVTSSVRSPSVPSVSAIKGSTSDSRLAVGSSIPVCTDSDNSEDHSSKSSTAASAPKSRFDVPLVMGSTRNKNKVRNPTGKSSGNAILRAQQGKGSIETSKKFRGERVKIEKENSYSSVESDSRSSNAVFAHMERFSGISNGRQSRKSSNHDGENSDDAHISEPQSSDEVQTAYCKENGGEVKDASQDDVAADVSWDVEEEKSDNHRPATDRDPLVDSILSLQAVQETLEREIQKFREIGQEHVVLPDNFIPGGCLPEEFASVDPEIHECNLSGQSCFKEAEPSSSAKHKVNIVENNIEEELAILKAKESGVVEPEAILDSGEMLKEESVSSVKSLQEKGREMEIELEDLFRQKIEAEFEYLVITRTTQRVKSAAEDQLLLLEEQKSLAGEQTQMLQKLTDAESKATVVKRQVDKLEASCGELLGTEEVLKMQNRVCKSTFYFIVQLILLFVAFGMFLLQLLPHSSGFVPT